MTAYDPKTRMSRNMEAVATAILLKDAEIKGDLFPKSEEKFGTNEPIPASYLGTWPASYDLDDCKTTQVTDKREPGGRPPNPIILSTVDQAPSTTKLKLALQIKFRGAGHRTTNYRQTMRGVDNISIDTIHWDMHCRTCGRGIRIRVIIHEDGRHQQYWMVTDRTGNDKRDSDFEIESSPSELEYKVECEIDRAAYPVDGEDVALYNKWSISLGPRSKQHHLENCQLASIPCPGFRFHQPTEDSSAKEQPIPTSDILLHQVRKVGALFNRIIRLRRKAQGSD